MSSVTAKRALTAADILDDNKGVGPASTRKGLLLALWVL